MSKKRVLFITQYFFPENFKGNDIAFHLAKEHEVTVVTAIPNYPQGVYYEGYGLLRKRKELINGVKVIRVPVIPRGKGTALGLMLNYFSFAFTASLFTFFLALFKKYDLVFVQQLSPVTLALPAVVYKKIRKSPIYLWVLDLWPESLQSAGGVTNKYIIGFFESITKLIYRNSHKILISSKGFNESITAKGIPEERLIYFPNWAEDVFTEKKETTIEIPELPEGFKVMFAGNIGEAQDFESIMKAALELKEQKQIKFIIIGDGRKRDWVESFIRENELHDTVFLLGRYPLEAMPHFFEKADVMLVTLKDEPIFNLTAPAKIQAYMAAGKPIVGMMNGEGARLIEEAGCGKCVRAGDSLALATLFNELYNTTIDLLNKFGYNGIVYCNNNFNKFVILDRLDNYLQLKIA